MIFLLNAERVISEIATLAKIRISETIGGIGPDQVMVELSVNDSGDLTTSFKVNIAEDATELEQERAEHAVRDYWMGTGKPELINRLKGLRERRHGTT